MIFDCPGSQKFRHPQPEGIVCPSCGKETEIWTDEAETSCEHCGRNLRRDAGQSCIDWCKEAKECVGEEIYRRFKKRG